MTALLHQLPNPDRQQVLPLGVALSVQFVEHREPIGEHRLRNDGGFLQSAPFIEGVAIGSVQLLRDQDAPAVVDRGEMQKVFEFVAIFEFSPAQMRVEGNELQHEPVDQSVGIGGEILREVNSQLPLFVDERIALEGKQIFVLFRFGHDRWPIDEFYRNIAPIELKLFTQICDQVVYLGTFLTKTSGKGLCADSPLFGPGRDEVFVQHETLKAIVHVGAIVLGDRQLRCVAVVGRINKRKLNF